MRKQTLVASLILLGALAASHGSSSLLAQSSFRRGDSNGDDTGDISDAVHTLLFLFVGGAPPSCMDAADSNDSGAVDISDASFTLSFLFGGGQPPPAPGPECGTDPTPDELPCDFHAFCSEAGGEVIIDGLRIVEGDIVSGVAGPILLRGPDGAGGGHSRDEEDNYFDRDAYRWPNGIVPYAIDRETRGGLPKRTEDSVMAAIAQWQASTHIRFVERTGSHSDFLLFRRAPAEDNCYSHVGRVPGGQPVGLADGCGKGQVMHEIGHALGLWHEQSRPDRDQFVKILFDNVESGKEHNFEIRDGTPIGPYDFDSIMHYGANFFARPGCNCNTIETIPGGIPIGQSNHLSAGDIEAVSYMYGFTRMGDSGGQAGDISEVAVADEGSMVVTAVKDGSGDLQVISWRAQDDGALSRLGESQAGSASSIDIAKGDRFVTALRDGGGDLLLIAWNVDPTTGAVSRAGDSLGQAFEADHIKIVALSNDLFVTALRTGDGNLLLIGWRLNANGSLTRLGDSSTQAGEVEEISLVGAGNRVITSVRNGDGNLLVIPWNVSAAGGFRRLIPGSETGNQAGEASQIRSTLVRSDTLVTSMRDGAGELLLISWRISSDGTTIARIADSGNQAGSIGNNALMSTPRGVVTAVNQGNGNLLMISWEVGSGGGLVRKGDSYSLAGEASTLALAQKQFGPLGLVLSTVRDGDGKLLLITWNPTFD